MRVTTMIWKEITKTMPVLIGSVSMSVDVVILTDIEFRFGIEAGKTETENETATTVQMHRSCSDKPKNQQTHIQPQWVTGERHSKCGCHIFTSLWNLSPVVQTFNIHHNSIYSNIGACLHDVNRNTNCRCESVRLPVDTQFKM